MPKSTKKVPKRQKSSGSSKTAKKTAKMQKLVKMNVPLRKNGLKIQKRNTKGVKSSKT